MIFYYIRHGDPVYTPDSLTPLGHEQAKALAKRLAQFGVDRVYASSSNRAMLTAQPTCDLLGLEMTTLDFAHEDLAGKYFSVSYDKGSRWCFYDPYYRDLFCSKEVRELGVHWYEHPALARFREGFLYYYDRIDELFASLGYEHDRFSGRYKVTRTDDDRLASFEHFGLTFHYRRERVALFAHQGFSMAFMRCALDIPYPHYAIHADICHTGLTAINFVEYDGWAIPRVMTMGNDSHRYREGLPFLYNNELEF